MWKKIYEYNNNKKIYIDECYDTTIKIGKKYLTDDNIWVDRQRKFTPGQIEKESMQTKLKEKELYHNYDDDEIDNKFILLKSSNWIETERISKKIDQCAINGLFLTRWRNIDSN